jgi:hypothetical protein
MLKVLKVGRCPVVTPCGRSTDNSVQVCHSGQSGTKSGTLSDDSGTTQGRRSFTSRTVPGGPAMPSGAGR